MTHSVRLQTATMLFITGQAKTVEDAFKLAEEMIAFERALQKKEQEPVVSMGEYRLSKASMVAVVNDKIKSIESSKVKDEMHRTLSDTYISALKWVLEKVI